ncbi:hypothetical protein HKX48_002212 [Thoreauomyces humboldtii]|nr:hypothetical protein HKX48_002212 [Thoreauomyces humboldtii]
MTWLNTTVESVSLYFGVDFDSYGAIPIATLATMNLPWTFNGAHFVDFTVPLQFYLTGWEQFVYITVTDDQGTTLGPWFSQPILVSASSSSPVPSPTSTAATSTQTPELLSDFRVGMSCEPITAGGCHWKPNATYSIQWTNYMWTYRHTQVLEITISLDPDAPDVVPLSPTWTPSVNATRIVDMVNPITESHITWFTVPPNFPFTNTTVYLELVARDDSPGNPPILETIPIFIDAPTPPACNKVALDSFTKTGTNDVGLLVGDDGTTVGYALANGVLSFTPKDGSYFYEDIGCVSAKGYLVFTLQTSSTIQFMPQVEAGCGAAGARYNGALVTGTFPNPTNIAIDISSLLTGTGALSIFSIALSSLANSAGTAPWLISNLVVVDRLPCGYSNMLMVTQTSFYWTAPGTTTSLPASSTVTKPLQPSSTTSTNTVGVDFAPSSSSPPAVSTVSPSVTVGTSPSSQPVDTKTSSTTSTVVQTHGPEEEDATSGGGRRWPSLVVGVLAPLGVAWALL